jgi:hypothetical protein
MTRNADYPSGGSDVKRAGPAFCGRSRDEAGEGLRYHRGMSAAVHLFSDYL